MIILPYGNIKLKAQVLLRSLTLVGMTLFSLTSCAYSDTDSSQINATNSLDLVGEVSKTQLNNEFSSFASNYADYQPSTEELNAVATLTNNAGEEVSITVFFATWCHDSEREVPRLLKAFNHSSLKITLIALDQEKSDPLQLARQNKIKYTPTFVITAKGKEIARIVERPKTTLAEDILNAWQQSQG